MKRISMLLLLFIGSYSQIRAQSENATVVSVAEQMPEFNGDLLNYLGKNLNYPASSRDNGVEGKVIAQFIVRNDGSIDSIHIVSSPDQATANEVVRIISGMPKWKPGLINGKPVDVKMTLPVVFKLDDQKTKKKK